MYLLIAYKSSGSNYSRGCTMESWDSEFEVHNHLTKEELQAQLVIYMTKDLHEWGEYEFIIFKDGVQVYDTVNASGFSWDGWNRGRNLERYSLESIEFENQDEQERDAAYGEVSEIIDAAKAAMIEENERQVRLKKENDEAEARKRAEQERVKRLEQYEQLKKEFDN